MLITGNAEAKARDTDNANRREFIDLLIEKRGKKVDGGDDLSCIYVYIILNDQPPIQPIHERRAN